MDLNYKHTAERTLSSDVAHVFDAGEASSADAGRLALPLRMEISWRFNKNKKAILFLALFHSESLYRCAQDKSHKKRPSGPQHGNLLFFSVLFPFVSVSHKELRRRCQGGSGLAWKLGVSR